MEIISTGFVFQEKSWGGRRFSRSIRRGHNRVLNGFSSVWHLPFFRLLRREGAAGNDAMKMEMVAS